VTTNPGARITATEQPSRSSGPALRRSIATGIMPATAADTTGRRRIREIEPGLDPGQFSTRCTGRAGGADRWP
jgi:hypothetical protein